MGTGQRQCQLMLPQQASQPQPILRPRLCRRCLIKEARPSAILVKKNQAVKNVYLLRWAGGPCGITIIMAFSWEPQMINQLVV